VGAVICQHMTHSADENSKKETAFNSKLWPKRHHYCP